MKAPQTNNSPAGGTRPASHTPGPWTHVPRARDGHVDVISHKGREFIHVGSPDAEKSILDYPHDNIQTANARLIAAAPDLLAALEALAALGAAGVVMRHETDKPTWSLCEEVSKIAREALDKAKGGK